ncbi:MAG TPA: glycoside-pentoside-hexuronide (GPH):cation symporter [Oscillospiraceae bacterium]|nr:glycoside-pentoside-hexuronide (GPH):cation symporter [Oscillospiraceae bacterium]
MENKLREFGIRDKIGYALGDFGCNLSFSLISAFLLIYYTQYMGLTPEQFGVIILVLKIWDAINDPLMGMIIDFKPISKESKFKPWIKIGSYGLIISGAAVFLPFPNASLWVKITVCLVSYLVWDACYTLVNVPYGAMNATISAKANERTSLSVWRSVGAALGGLVVMLLPLICYDDDDRLLGERFFYIALIMGGIAFAAYMGLLKLTTERVKIVQSEEKTNYREAIKGFMKNRPLFGLSIASFMQIVFFMSTTTTTALVFQIYFRQAKMTTVGTIAAYAPQVICLLLTSALSKKYGKRFISAAPLIISIFSAVLILFVPLSRDSGLWVYVAFLMVANLGGGFFNFVVWAMVSDCVDYQQLKTGKREEGGVYAIYSLFRKLAQGVGASLLAFLLKYVGYNSALGAMQTEQTAINIKNMSIILILIGAITMFISLFFIYNLGKKEVKELSATLGLGENTVDINKAFENKND